MDKNKMRPLGRGLDALIRPDALQNATEEKVIKHDEIQKDDGAQFDIIAKIPIDKIEKNPFQPRTVFEPEALEELKKSILANGLIQPITVRRIPDNKYQLISGERRLRACTDIGYKEIPAYIIKVETDEGMLALALIENLQRKNLNPIEIGIAYKRLMDECHLTQEQIAETVGKDRTTIANAIRLLKLPEEIQNALVKEELTSGHARALINLPTPKMQLDALRLILDQNLSVRKVEQLVKKMLTTEPVSKIERQVSVSKSGSDAGMRDIEDKLRRVFGTKVLCRQKNDGTGEITIEFYSNDELERLFELFSYIEKYYS